MAKVSDPEGDDIVRSQLSIIRRHSSQLNLNKNNSNNSKKDAVKKDATQFTRGIPLLQLIIAIVLDLLQIIKSEKIKVLVEKDLATDVPYEAAIAAGGALLAGASGLLASSMINSRWPRVMYGVLSFVALGCSFFCVVKTVTIYASKAFPSLVALHWAVIMFSIFLSLYNICAIYNAALFIFAFKKAPPDQEPARNEYVKVKKPSEPIKKSETSVKHTNGNCVKQSSTDLMTENTRLIITEPQEEKISVQESSDNVDQRTEVPQILSNNDEVFSEKPCKLQNPSIISKSSSSFIVENNAVVIRSDSDMFRELNELGRAPICRIESGLHKISVSSSGDFFTASTSGNQISSEMITPSMSEVSKLSKEETFDESEDLTTMNVIYENDRVVTKSVTKSSLSEVFSDDVIPQVNGVKSSVASTPKSVNTIKDNINTTREDLWNIISRIMGTHGSQESISSAMSTDRSIKYNEHNRAAFSSIKKIIVNLKAKGEDFHHSVSNLENRINEIESNEKYVDDELGPLLAIVQFNESLRRVSQSLLDLSGIEADD